jgi:hypothetical protein
MRWLLPIWLLVELPASFAPQSLLNWDTGPAPLETLVVLAALGSVLFSQLYRYRRVSTLDQRQQTKWAVFGLAVGLAGFFAAGAFGLFAPRVLALAFPQARWFSSPALGIAAITLTYAALLLIPVFFALAIMRSHLYDVDLIINRTLIYGSLSGMLAAIYLALVVGLQALAEALTGRRSLPPVLIVLSTLVIAALFGPLRRRIQHDIDRGFYRRKYDATQTLAAFAGRLRHEVDLDQVSAQLVAVVQETMQPAHVSLWLRPPARRQA